jgi:hypothetical protein
MADPDTVIHCPGIIIGGNKSCHRKRIIRGHQRVVYH